MIDGVPQFATYDRLMKKIEVVGECWLWTAGKAPNGYGKCWLDGRTVGAHRAIYELLVGPIPEGLVIDHLCRVRHCVNPDHLEPVTQQENLLRGDTFQARNRAKTHCPQGHPYDESNTRMFAGKRACRTCGRKSALIRMRKNRKKQAACVH